MHPRENKPADPHALLEQHRRDIEALDRRILHLVCERLELARQVGDLKRSLAVPLRNFGVEAQVYQRFEDASALLGLDAGLGRDLARFLIEKAVEKQASLRDVVYAGGALDTVVIGGKGGMGRWIGRFLAGQGHRVRVIDPGSGETPFEEVGSLAEAHDCDLIMVAVPMTVCPDILDELGAIGPRGVVAEMCSLKTHLGPVIERLRSTGTRVVSFHPMFGPDVRMLEGRTVVLCTDAPRADLEVVEGLFADTSARLVEMDSAEHDRRMGLVLGLTHLANLVFARALVHSGVGSPELAEVAGVTFGRQIATTREVTSENPSLYYEIQALNELTPETGRWLSTALDEWMEAVEQPDHGRFAELMSTCREALEGARRNGV
jgi:prephenate dehydrogenase/chorismate mutase